jgi:hypothetical protein
MADVKDWLVILSVNWEHSYTVRARTPEEAETIAEDSLDSGDKGEISEGPEIISSEAISLEGADNSLMEEEEISFDLPQKE